MILLQEPNMNKASWFAVISIVTLIGLPNFSFADVSGCGCYCGVVLPPPCSDEACKRACGWSEPTPEQQPVYDPVAERHREAENLFHQGLAYFNAGNFAAAVDSFRAAVEKWPENKKFGENLKSAEKALQKQRDDNLRSHLKHALDNQAQVDVRNDLRNKLDKQQQDITRIALKNALDNQVPVSLPAPDDNEMRYLKNLIQRYNGDASVKVFLGGLGRARQLFDRVEKLTLVITACDPQAKIAQMTVKRLEKEAVAAVRKKLKSDLNRLRKNVDDWGITDNARTRAERQEKLAEIREQEKWLSTVTRQAIREANSGINQTSGPGSGTTPKATITVGSSPAATTSSITLNEGPAMRQLRNAARNGW
jgi:tetratricopeptide (TPR) repeat protein